MWFSGVNDGGGSAGTSVEKVVVVIPHPLLVRPSTVNIAHKLKYYGIILENMSKYFLGSSK